MIVSLIQRSGSPEYLCSIFLPLMPFLWRVKVRVTDEDACIYSSEAVAAKTLSPQLNTTSYR